MARIAVVILAAGQGTRMKSLLPKVLHPVGGIPMVLWSVNSARALGADQVALVIGNGAEAVRETVGAQALYALQAERLGTGHAALQAKSLLEGKADIVLVLYGDMPALRRETLQRMLSWHQERKPALTMLSVLSDDSMGFGRLVRDAEGRPRAIVEEAVATPEILELKELNCGIYCFEADWLWENLPKIKMTMPKGEYYLTDVVELAAKNGRDVEVVTIDDISEVQGINTRVHLARAERILRERIAEHWMNEGVTVIDPATTYIHEGVRIGRDTVIQPNTHLQGNTVIGENCVIGPNSIIRDTRIGNQCEIICSVLEEAVVEDHVDMGPFGHLRPGAHLCNGVHMGNFGEVKNATLGPGTHMGHFSYVGDADVGRDVNISAGNITCNYDGVKKNRTVIGDGAFVGSGTMMVAPVEIGAGAVVGAGSVVTRDVAPGTLAFGVPAREKRVIERKENDE